MNEIVIFWFWAGMMMLLWDFVPQVLPTEEN